MDIDNTVEKKKKIVGGKNENNNITGSDGDEIIIGGNMDDYIKAGAGNDKITGGKGTNTIEVSTSEAFGDDEIVLTKGENLIIKLDVNTTGCTNNYEGYTYTYIDGNDLKISVYNQMGSNSAGHNGDIMGTITVKNYAKKDVQTSAGSILVTNSDCDIETAYDARKYVRKIVYMNPTTNLKSYNGSWINERIDATAFVLKDKNGNSINAENTEREILDKTKGVTVKTGNSTYSDVVWGSIYADTITGGDGNDYINAHEGNDKIKGGKGINTIYYKKGDGNDVITLTKGENFKLNFTGLTQEDLSYRIEKGNVLIDYYDEGKKTTITLKGFGAKDITNNSTKTDADSSSVDMIFYGDEEHPVSLRTLLYELPEAQKNWNGTWHSEQISAENYTIKKKGVEVAWTDKLKGLTMNGGAGNDKITGTKYKDTIKGGLGDDKITGGKGNDKLYGVDGENTYIFNSGDGVDTVYAGKGEDTIKINGTDAELLLYCEQGEGKNAKDLIIHYGVDRKSYIIVKDYYKKLDEEGNSLSSLKYIDVDGHKRTIQYIMDHQEANAASILLGGDEGGNYAPTGNNIAAVITGSGNDIIDLTQSNRNSISVNAGDGENTITGKTGSTVAYTIESGSGVDIITTGNGTDVINAGAGNNVITAGNGKKTITTGSGDDTITIGNGSYYSITSTGGDNTITTGTGYEGTITTGSGDDEIIVGGDENIISAGNGNNEITLNGEENVVTTGSGIDTIVINADENIVTIGTVNAQGKITTQGGAENEVTINGDDNTITIKSDQVVQGKYNTVTIDGDSNAVNILGGTNEITVTGGSWNEINTGSGDDTITINGSGYGHTVDAGNGSNTVVATAGANITTGSGIDNIITAGGNVYSGAGNDTINLYANGETNYIHAGAGDDTIIIQEGKSGHATVYLDEPNGQNGHDVIKGSFANNNYLAIETGDKLVEFTASQNAQDARSMDITFYKNGIKTGDVLTIQGAYDEEGILISDLEDSSNRINSTCLENLPTGIVTSQNGIVNGTNAGEWLIGSSGNDTINTDGFEEDYIKTGGGVDTVNLGSGLRKHLYFLKGDGQVTVNGIGPNTDLSVYIDDKENLTFTKVGKDLILKNSTDSQMNLKNFFKDDGSFVNDSYIAFLDELGNSMLSHWSLYKPYGVLQGFGFDVYPDSDGVLRAPEIVECNITYHTNELENTINIYNQSGTTYNIISDGSEAPDTIDFSFADMNNITWSKDGNALIMQTNDSEPITVKIQDYFPTDDNGLSSTYAGSVIFNSGEKVFGEDIKITDLYGLYGSSEAELLIGVGSNSAILGRGGSDTIISYSGSYICTNTDIDHSRWAEKDTTVGTSVTVKTYGNNKNTIHAQSAQNYIYSYSTGNDDYSAYIDQITYIQDSGGDDDTLTLQNSYIEESPNNWVQQTDGNKSNVTVLFSEVDNESYRVNIVSNSLIDDWKSSVDVGGVITGIDIMGNEIETITTADGYYVTSESLAEFASAVATWLTDDGRSYDSVRELVSTNDSTDMTAFMTFIQAQNASLWTAPTP